MNIFRSLAASAAGLLARAGQALAMGPSEQRQEQQLSQLYSSSQEFRTQWSSGPGWSQAQVKRMARKKRNQKANRKAHRG